MKINKNELRVKELIKILGVDNLDSLAVIVNGKPIDELNYRLRDDDQIVFATPEVGG